MVDFKNLRRNHLKIDVTRLIVFGCFTLVLVGLESDWNAGLDRSENYSIVMVLQEMLSHLRKLQKLSRKGVYMIAILGGFSS